MIGLGIGLGLPWVMGLAALAALAVAALHLLSVREPPLRPLPTARFVPGGDARAVARQPRLSDRRLLALRLLALLALGAAFSGVRCGTGTRGTVELVYVAPSVARDSLQWRGGLPTDSSSASTRIVATLTGVHEDPGIAIVQGLRDASRIATDASDVERIGLTVVLPPEVQTVRGWQSWRSQWPAQIRVVVHGEAPRRALRFHLDAGAADDPVRAVLRDIERPTAAETAGTRVVRVVRDSAGEVRRETVGAMRANVTVYWPRSGIPATWATLEPPDTVGAFVAGARAVVGPFVRMARFGASSGGRPGDDRRPEWRPIAWWSDGEVAAVERTIRDGCERQVGIVIPTGTDLLLSTSARGLLDALLAPCGGVVDARSLTGTGVTRPSHLPAASVRQRSRRDPSSDPAWLMPMFLIIGLAALRAESWWRTKGSAP